MISFDINVSQVLNNTEKLKNKINDYKDNISTLTNNLKNVDSCWCDQNSEFFITTIKKDKNNYIEHILTIKSYINLIDEFCEDLKNIFDKKMEIDSLKSIKYNSLYLDNTISSLENCYSKLDIILNTLESMTIPMDFKYKTTIEKYYSEISIYKKEIINFKIKLESIKSLISEYYEKIKLKRNNIDFITINPKELNYVWKTIDFNLKNNQKQIKLKKENVTQNTETINLEKVELSVNDGPKLNSSIEDVKLKEINVTNPNKLENSMDFSSIKNNIEQEQIDVNLNSKTNISDLKDELDDSKYINQINSNNIKEKNEMLNLNDLSDELDNKKYNYSDNIEEISIFNNNAVDIKNYKTIEKVQNLNLATNTSPIDISKSEAQNNIQ